MGEFKQLSRESITQFQEGISLTLSTWDALEAGLANGFGNQNQVLNFASRIFTFFHLPNRKEPIYIDDLEELLHGEMISLGIFADDGSIEEVAEALMMMHEECLVNQYQSIQKLRDRKRVLSSVVRQVINDSDEDEDEDDEASDMMVDSQESLPNVIPSPIQKNESGSQQGGADEDGWVTVSSRKNRGRNP